MITSTNVLHCSFRDVLTVYIGSLSTLKKMYVLYLCATREMRGRS